MGGGPLAPTDEADGDPVGELEGLGWCSDRVRRGLWRVPKGDDGVCGLNGLRVGVCVGVSGEAGKIDTPGGGGGGGATGLRPTLGGLPALSEEVEDDAADDIRVGDIRPIRAAATSYMDGGGDTLLVRVEVVE